jgi:hypothetical protein
MDVAATTFGNPAYCRGPLSVLAGSPIVSVLGPPWVLHDLGGTVREQ